MEEEKKLYDIFLEYKVGELRVSEKKATNIVQVISNILRDAIHYKDITHIHAIEIEVPRRTNGQKNYSN